jgi:hypothetical protein
LGQQNAARYEVAVMKELSESDLLDLRAQLDGVPPDHSTVIDVGVVQALVEMALELLEREST